MADAPRTTIIGRGSPINPANRYERTRLEDDFEQCAVDDERLAPERKIATELIPDQTQRIITENDSPDIGFRYSINPYRGCEHGCSYCYARPSHEMLGLNAGLDFETKILFKPDAARDALGSLKHLPRAGRVACQRQRVAQTQSAADVQIWNAD